MWEGFKRLFGFGGNQQTVPGFGGGTYDIGDSQRAPNVEFEGALRTIEGMLFNILMAAAVISIIIAAFLFITAAGDPEKIKKARLFVIYALVGVVVAILASGIVNYLDNSIV